MSIYKEILGSSLKKFQPLISGIKGEFVNLKKKYVGFQPVIAIIEIEQASGHLKDPLSLSSVLKDIAAQCSIETTFVSLPRSPTDNLVLNTIRKLNVDPNIHGIVFELSDLDLDSETIFDAIQPNKDIAGVSSANVKHINLPGDASLLPATALAVMEFIRSSEVSLEKAKAFITGKKHDVFSTTQMLLLKNATVTMCQKTTEKISTAVSESDIIIAPTEELSIIKSKLKPGSLLIELYCTGGKTSDVISSESSSPQLCGKSFQILKSIMIVRNLLYTVKRLFESEWKLKPLTLNFGPPGLSDIEITRLNTGKDISVLAEEIGLLPHELELYGDKKAKVSLSVSERLKFRNYGKYVVVSGITPTPLGEGKSTTTLGLCQALGALLEKNVIATLRQPSQGPTFGVKGGAAGGGYSQVVPMEDFNLHLTGDIHAVTAANNLLAAQLDARMFHEATQKDEDLYKRLVKVVKGKKEFSKIQISRLKKLGIDKTDPDTLTKEEVSRFVRLDINPATITWNRVLDTNDRFLRKIAIGLAATEKNMTRETQFDIAVASEIMAILALANDMADMKEKLSKIVVANDHKGQPITADDLGVTGALAVLLRDSIRPNLMQTIEGTPVFVHAGPFANIAHGNSSIIADKMALKIVGEDGFVVTEAGFGADIGLEKFCDIKCRYSGLTPNVVVIVATIRALKLHGGGPNIAATDSLRKEYTEENLDLVSKGYCNLGKHIQIASKFGLPVIVAVNRFSTDTEAELNMIKELAEKDGAFKCVICSHFSEGSKGAKELAEAVVAASVQPQKFRFLYDVKDSIENKISFIAKEVYGADDIEMTEKAKQMIELFEKQGFGDLPICMAKTPLSLSDNPAKKGVPVNFKLPIKDAKLSAGAGFVYPLVGSILTMPGLSTRPCIYDIDIDANTLNIEGLF